MPRSIPSGLKPEHILRAIADLDAGSAHPFGSSTKYDLLHEGKRYAPKAVIGLAFRSVRGSLLKPEEFSGGEEPGQANFVLRKLRFPVVRKDESVADQEQEGADWTHQEVELLVADYFKMLEAELFGVPFNESEHRNALARKLTSKSESSIRSKHQNLSGVLLELGLPYVERYKPKSSDEQLLAAQVEAFLDGNPGVLDRLAQAPALDARPTSGAGRFKPGRLIEEPPERIVTPKRVRKPWLSRKERKIDFAERDAMNRRLGKMGERFVLELELRRLKKARRDDLAKKVVWASQEIGDGLGFDIITFDTEDETEQLLEVKTTGLGKFFPFYVTENELRCSDDVPQQYQLYRLFDFARDPRLYILHGSLRGQCQLEPVLYRAAP